MVSLTPSLLMALQRLSLSASDVVYCELVARLVLGVLLAAAAY